ncbi:MPN domain-containing protein [Sarcoptes scabiei]|nr:MPN domain-containing protein [Sarcoptes scabiei]
MSSSSLTTTPTAALSISKKQIEQVNQEDGDDDDGDDDDEPTPEMALFPGIVISTSNTTSSSVAVSKGKNTSIKSNKTKKSHSNDPQFRPKRLDESINSHDDEQQEHSIGDDFNTIGSGPNQRVHFKKALIYSSSISLNPMDNEPSSDLDPDQDENNQDQIEINDMKIGKGDKKLIRNDCHDEDDDDDDEEDDEDNDDGKEENEDNNGEVERMMIDGEDDDDDDDDGGGGKAYPDENLDNDSDQNDEIDEKTQSNTQDEIVFEAKSSKQFEQQNLVGKSNNDSLNAINLDGDGDEDEADDEDVDGCIINEDDIEEEEDEIVDDEEILDDLSKKLADDDNGTELRIKRMKASNSSPFSSRSATTSSVSIDQLSMMPQVTTHVGRKPLNGPPCSLKTLVDDRILEPLNGSLTYEIFEQKFFGDLLTNGFIRLSGTNQVFANPSSWANYCRSTIPSTSRDQKNYGSAWSIIRYLGKRLDSYKLRWYRKQKKQFISNGSFSSTNEDSNNSFQKISQSSSSSSLNLNNQHKSNNRQNNHLINSSSPNLDGCNNSSKNFNKFTSPNFKISGNFPSISGSPMMMPTSIASSTNGLGLVGGSNNTSSRALSNSNQHQFSTPIQMSRSNAEYKNLFTMYNRERLYKLDKISAGDMEIQSENFLDENLINFNSIDINNKELVLDDKIKIGCVPFNNVFCLQPFLVAISTNVLLLIDFHSHLLSTEIKGYLAGTWNPRTQLLSISQAYPIRCSNEKDLPNYLSKIKQQLVQKNLILVGWYHSHPQSPPHPTIKDIKNQLKYQKKLLYNKKDSREYSPCVGLICSPFYRKSQSRSSAKKIDLDANNTTANNALDGDDSSLVANKDESNKMNSLFQMFWVMPIFTMGNRNIGRPMQISYTIARDAFLTQDLLVEMRIMASHFSSNKNFIKFNDDFDTDHSYWDKLKESLRSKLPRDLVEQQSQTVQNDIQQQALMHFWSFLKNLLLIS